jgi:hypothetical protein
LFPVDLRVGYEQLSGINDPYKPCPYKPHPYMLGALHAERQQRGCRINIGNFRSNQNHRLAARPNLNHSKIVPAFRQEQAGHRASPGNHAITWSLERVLVTIGMNGR